MQILTRLRNLFCSSSATEKWVPDSIYPDDVFIVSYPKSGNTWVRFLVGNYLTGNDCTFENCHRITPDLHMNPEYCSEVERPRFIKSHAPYRSQYPKVVYVVRDGRDVAVSYYHHCIRKGQIESDTSFPAFLKMFNEGEADEFGRWGQHVTSWIERGNQFLVVKYEDLQQDAESELRRVLEFAGVAVREEPLTEAVEASSFENMKETEEKERHRIERLKEDAPTKRFMRKGKTGEWRTYFNSELHKDFLEAHGEGLHRGGYSTNL
jgi:hypothetical protein